MEDKEAPPYTTAGKKKLARFWHRIKSMKNGIHRVRGWANRLRPSFLAPSVDAILLKSEPQIQTGARR